MQPHSVLMYVYNYHFFIISLEIYREAEAALLFIGGEKTIFQLKPFMLRLNSISLMSNREIKYLKC